MNNWITQEARFIGLYHKKTQIPCQDAIAQINTAEMTLAVVADGVGNLCNSHIASRAAVEATQKWFQSNLKKLSGASKAEALIKSDLLPTLRSNNLVQAQKHGVMEDSMDCNLAFVCILPKYGFALCGVLGDGAVCVLHQEKAFVITSIGSFSANGTETIMLPDASSRINLHTCNLSDGKYLGFMVMSDGLDGEIYRKNSHFLCKPAEAYFNAMLLPEESDRKNAIERMLTDLPDELDDDISLVVISNDQRTQPYTLPHAPTWRCTCGYRNSLVQPFCGSCNEPIEYIYRDVNLGSSLPDFFYDLNRDPLREQQLLNLPSEPAHTPTPQAPQPNTQDRPRNFTAPPKRTARSPVTPIIINTPPKAEMRSSQSNAKPSTSANTPSASATSSRPQNPPTPEQPNHSMGGSFPQRELRIPDDALFRGTPTSSKGTPPPKKGGDKERPDRAPHKTLELPNTPIAIAAIIYIIFLSIAVVVAHIRISLLTAELHTYTQTSVVETTSKDVYEVISGSADLWPIEDGVKVNHRICRLDYGDKLERLDDQTQNIDGIEYIFVRCEKNGEIHEGWCNLLKLSPVTPQDTP